jgi:hypothetical protein
MKFNHTLLSRFTLLAALLAAPLAHAQMPSFDNSNPSPSAGDSISQQANAAADKTLYKDVNYTNANKQGPALIVIPGEIKSNNATFTQKYSSNNIADYAELELGKANFRVLERTSTNSSWPIRWAIQMPRARCCKKESSRPPSGWCALTS